METTCAPEHTPRAIKPQKTPVPTEGQRSLRAEGSELGLLKSPSARAEVLRELSRLIKNPRTEGPILADTKVLNIKIADTFVCRENAVMLL